MATSTMIHIRIHEQVKREATETLAAMGLSISDAVRVFLLLMIAERQMPFAIKVPIGKTGSEIPEAEEIALTRRCREPRRAKTQRGGVSSQDSSMKNNRMDPVAILDNPDQQERHYMAERILESFGLSDFGYLLKKGLDKTMVLREPDEKGVSKRQQKADERIGEILGEESVVLIGAYAFSTRSSEGDKRHRFATSVGPKEISRRSG